MLNRLTSELRAFCDVLGSAGPVSVTLTIVRHTGVTARITNLRRKIQKPKMQNGRDDHHHVGAMALGRPNIALRVTVLGVSKSRRTKAKYGFS